VNGEGIVNESLLYFARHNAWASKALLDVCRTLTPDQLTAPAAATSGTIIATFDHLVTAEGGFLHSLGGPQTPWMAAAERELEKHPEPWRDWDDDRRMPADSASFAIPERDQA
jgi:uncharacterized damage-inducible protein DinB